MNGTPPSSSSASSLLVAPLLVTDVPRSVHTPVAARITVIPLPAPHSPVYNPALPSLGRLLPFPSSYQQLLVLISRAFGLPRQSLSGLRLFVDEGPADHPYTADPSLPAHVTVARGGELLPQSFALLRDNDVLLLHLSDPPSPPPSPSTPPPPLIAPPSSSWNSTTSSSISSSSSLPHRPPVALSSAPVQRFELTIVDRQQPTAPTSRFALSAHQPLRKLRRKYAEIRRWPEAGVTFTVRKRQVDGREVEEALDVDETCVQLGLDLKGVIYAQLR